MKKRLALCALILLLLSVSLSSTIAYFTTEDTATNVITAGNLSIDLREMTESGEEFKDVVGVMPGVEVSKIVTVKNTGDHPAYVRILVEKGIELAQGREGKADLSLLQLDLNTADWTEKDGVYYYNKPLAPGAETPALFTTVKFSEKMDNLYQNSKAIIEVSAQAVQTAHNGTSALTAAGWPEV